MNLINNVAEANTSISCLYTLAFAIFLIFYSSSFIFNYLFYFLFILLSSVECLYILFTISMLDLLQKLTHQSLALLSLYIEHSPNLSKLLAKYSDVVKDNSPFHP